MNRIIGLLVLGTTVGCGLDELQVGVEEAQVIGAPHCPDGDRCGIGNGGGTYTEELGFAGIGPNEFMITRFVNHGGVSVSIDGRYHRPGTPYWSVSTGSIDHATYKNVGGYSVLAVAESGTTPKWWLSDGTNPPISVTGQQIVNMTLVVALDDENTRTKQYTLSFKNYGSATITVSVNDVEMLWKPTNQPVTPLEYCFDASGKIDPIVFQQGIAINAINANVIDRNNAYVTMSCTLGAIATVRQWGYTYRTGSNTPDLFDAALHMKRASYCGDDSFYTEAGTDIAIHDSFPVHSDSMSPSTVEAVWDSHGALCVNNDVFHRRHFGATYFGSPFDPSQCPTPPPDCVTWAATQPAGSKLGDLADRAISPGL